MERRAKFVVLHCGHTAWVDPDVELGDFVECITCPTMEMYPGPDDNGTSVAASHVPRRVWVIAELLEAGEFPGVIETATRWQER